MPTAALARIGVTQPIARPVPSDDAFFLADKGTLKVALRVLRRRLELAASGQRPLQRQRIEPAWRRAVWFHAEAPQIGDALMDLAPRSLLAEHGIALDLLAPPATAALFAGDRGFRAVFADERDVDPAGCDFAIVDSTSWKALAAKRRRAPRLPWVSIRERYLGYDFQRGLFATRRLAELLQLRLGDTDEARHARQKLMPANDAAATAADAAQTRPRIAVALGGVRAERTYRHWAAVARLLAEPAACSFTLLGSANARAAADALLGDAALAAPIDDLVQRTDLHQARRAMQAADLVLCADGGLMHLALTTATPVLALFDASVDPAWRLPADFAGATLRAAERDVSALPAATVAAAALRLLAPPPAAPIPVSAGR